MEISLERARCLHAAGDLRTAATIYRKLIEQAADVEAMHLLGILCAQQGESQEGIRWVERALAARPGVAVYHFNLGVIFEQCGEVGRAIEAWTQATRCDPHYAPAWQSLAAHRQRIHDPVMAVTALEQRLRLEPLNLDYLCDLADFYAQQQRREEANTTYRQVLRLDPTFIRAINNLANLLKADHDLVAAGQLYQQAIDLKPEDAALYFNLANVWLLMNAAKPAEDCYQRSLALDDRRVEAWLGLGGIYQRQGKLNEASHCFERAYGLRPQAVSVLAKMVQLDQQRCRWDRLESLTLAMLSSLDRDAPASPLEVIPPFYLLGLDPAATPSQQLRCAVKYCHYIAQTAAGNGLSSKDVARPARPWFPDRRLRLGYLSADFRTHPVGILIPELLEGHDRRHFEVYAYSYGPDDDSDHRRRIRQAVDSFVDIESFSFSQAATRIAADEIDILIDLQGHTGDARPEILVARPAPRQLAYLGYAGTIGADYIDCSIVDRYLVPPGHRRFFHEKLAYLPDCFLVADSQRYRPWHDQGWLEVAFQENERRLLRRKAGLPEAGFVFCAFGASAKLTPKLFDIWLRLLKQIPESVLWLRIDLPEVLANLKEWARQRGVDEHRLIGAARVSGEEHLQRHVLADLFLDTFPYNQHSTAADALGMGLPLITCSGDTFASRVAGSLLYHLGFSELITADLAGYEALALGLALDCDRLRQVRQRLRYQLLVTSLFDGRSFAAKIEGLYRELSQTAVSR
jgi:protein O-GlcNAc transferase